MNQKILHLHLDFKWYDLIDAGIKKEEYRLEKWKKRLCRTKGDCDYGGYCQMFCRSIFQENPKSEDRHPFINYENLVGEKSILTDYTHVMLWRGYTSVKSLRILKMVIFGKGKKEWGAPDENCFILKLGDKIQ